MRCLSLASFLKLGLRAVDAKVLPLLLCLAFVGCAVQNESAGKGALDFEEHSFIVVGNTTKAQLVEKFGPPNQTMHNSAGIETLTWGHSSRIVDPQFYIPFVGGLISGATTKYHALNVVVSKQGTVLDFSFSRGLHRQKSKF